MTIADLRDRLGEIFQEKEMGSNPDKTGALLEGFLEAMVPLGVIKKSDAGYYINGIASQQFLESYLFFYKNNHSIISDWERIGGEFKNPELLFDKGIRLLSLLEKKRSQYDDAYPLKEIKIVKAIIKANDILDKEYFLAHLDENSHYYQMIGGKIKNNESEKDALVREMDEEIPNFNLKFNKDFFATPVDPGFHELRFVSPKHGVITNYMVRYFFVEFKQVLELRGSLRWISKDEFLSGVTEDGFGIIPPTEEFIRLTKLLPEGRLSLPNKLPINETKVNVGDKFEAKQKLNSHMAISLLGDAETEIDHNKCFVIMPYSESWSGAVEKIIEEICVSHKLEFKIAKNMEGRFIPNDIWKGITGSGLIIADLTGGNPNVTYEVGLADVLGKETVLICQGTKLPFDFSGQRLLTYENSINGTIELKEKLKDRIAKYLKKTPVVK